MSHFGVCSARSGCVFSPHARTRTRRSRPDDSSCSPVKAEEFSRCPRSPAARMASTWSPGSPFPPLNPLFGGAHLSLSPAFSARALVGMKTAQGEREGETRGEILRRPPEPAGAPPLKASWAVAPIIPTHSSPQNISPLNASPKIALRGTCVHFPVRAHSHAHALGGVSGSTDGCPSHGHARDAGPPQPVCGAASTSAALSHT